MEAPTQGSSLSLLAAAFYFLLVIGGGMLGEMMGLEQQKAAMIALSFLGLTCFRINRTGHRSQFTWFSRRLQFFGGEGLQFVLWFLGFGQLVEDCRTKLHRLDELELNTKDNVRVKVRDGALLHRIADLDKYHNLDTSNPKALDEYLDTFWSQVIREWVAGEEYANLKREDIKDRTLERAKEALEWGIEVSDVNIPEILAANPETQAAFELHAVEKQERIGQGEEGDFVTELVKRYQLPLDEGGAGMTYEDAVEQARLVTRQTTRHSYNVNHIDSLIRAFLEGRK